jgi:DNA-directed RNA polymerase subunit RPC12/RpoP
MYECPHCSLLISDDEVRDDMLCDECGNDVLDYNAKTRESFQDVLTEGVIKEITFVGEIFNSLGAYAFNMILENGIEGQLQFMRPEHPTFQPGTSIMYKVEEEIGYGGKKFNNIIAIKDWRKDV